MKRFIRINIIMVILFLWSNGVLAQDNLQFVNLGGYHLENGQVIRDCRLAYRTFGVLNQDQSNASTVSHLACRDNSGTG